MMRHQITEGYVADNQPSFGRLVDVLSNRCCLIVILIQVERELFLNSISWRVSLFTAEKSQRRSELDRAFEVLCLLIVAL